MGLSPGVVFKTMNRPWIEQWIDKHRAELINRAQRLSEPSNQKSFYEDLENVGYHRIPKLFTRQLINGLRKTKGILPSNEVHVGHSEKTTWLEHRFPDDTDFPNTLLASFDIIDFVTPVLPPNGPDIRRIQAWINTYRPGEFIPEHSDSDGVLQLLIELQTPRLNDYGFLCINGHNVDVSPGDLIVFRAHECPHRTRPVPEHAGQSRENLVIRFYD